MTILLLVKNFDLGGTEVHVRELANGLAKSGNKVIVLARKGRQEKYLHPKVTFLPHRFSNLRLPWSVKLIRSLITEKKIDIVHGHQRLPILASVIAGSCSKTPCVATIHGRIRLDARPSMIRRWIDRMIVVSPNRLTALSPADPLRKRCRVIYNGLINSPQPKARTCPNLVRILYASRIDSKHSIFLTSFLRHIWPKIRTTFPDAQFDILGDGEHLESVREAAAPFLDPAQPSVILHGFVPSLEPYLRKASITLGVGRVAIESLALGVPVIPVNSAHQAPLVTRENYERLKADNFVGRPFFAFSPNRLLDHLMKTLDNLPASWDATSDLMTDVHEDFSLARMINATQGVYRELITFPTSRPAN
ncbi:MAG: glycosyltransferase family 4 protein [Akkermansiaceae bacterium]